MTSKPAMMRRVSRIAPHSISFLIVGVCTLAFPFLSAADEMEAELRETGRLLAILLDSGRVAIARNQALLNDSSKGNKGFTPDVFAAQAMAVFKERTSHDLTDLSHAKVPEMAKPLLEQLLAESKRTVASYQPVINMQGIVYKGFIPATFGTETGTRFQKWSGVYLKQTAPEHLLRNKKNKPDEFEVAQMARIGDPAYSRAEGAIVSETVEGGKSVRVLLPLFYEKACLSCHGQPKGERDISGYSREGGKEGDLGGAISVKIERPSVRVPPF